MSQDDDSIAGQGGGGLMGLIRSRQGAAGSTQILDLSYANLDTFPSEIEFLRDVLEKLTMSHNSIRTLPLQLNMFTSLRYLNIRANSIRIFPAVLCLLSSLEILDMSRNKISRFPENFGNLMNLRVLSISRNRLESIPLYVGDMSHLQFLKIEQNPIAFPPPEIIDFPGQDMEGWLNHLKAFLRSQKKDHEIQQPARIQEGETEPRISEPSIGPHRTVRSSSAESLMIPSIQRQSRGEPGLRLSIPTAGDRSAPLSATLSPEPLSHKLGRTNSQHNSYGDDHYRFISHSRGVSGDSTSSLNSSTSNDCEKHSDIYFQRLATHPPPSTPLPHERARLVEAARGILFALSQVYKAVKQCIGFSNDEKFSVTFNRLLLNASTAMAQLIQSLDRFDNSAQLQVPDQNLCAEILRCCESNVAVFRKLVHMVQAQIKAISLAVDARLVRNLVLMLHGALSEIRLAWDSLLPLIQGAGEAHLDTSESAHVLKEQQQHLHHVTVTSSVQLQQHHQQHHQPIHHGSSSHPPGQTQPHPFQLSPTLVNPSNWQPIHIPQRNQTMSRTSNHSSQSIGNGNIHMEEEEDIQVLLTVEHAIDAARRLIQCLTETCMTRVENLLASPQQRPTHRTRSISTSPPRSSSSSGSSRNSGSGSGKIVPLDQQGRTLSMSPLQLSSSNAGPASSNAQLDGTNLIRSPLFSATLDTVPYSNGMCLSLPIDQSAPGTLRSTTTTTTTITTETTTLTASDAPAGQGEDVPKHERRSHTKGSSRSSFESALPPIPQDEASESAHQSLAPAPLSAATSTPVTTHVMAGRSASVSVVSSNSGHTTPGYGAMASSLPTSGFLTGQNGQQNSVHPHYSSQASYPQPSTPGLYFSTSSTFPLSSLNGQPLPPSQLWREMKDCLLQMTEIVKRLDLDLTMIRTDEHLHPHHHSHHPHHPHQGTHSQDHPQSIHHALSHPHPHSAHFQPHGPSPFPHPHQGYQSGHSGSGSDDPHALRRRFGMGVSDFVKSVIVISTLVRQLSSTGSVSGSGSGLANNAAASSTFSRSATGMATSTVTTTLTALSTTNPTTEMPTRSGSGSGSVSRAGGEGLSATAAESSPVSKVVSVSVSASSSSTGVPLTASPEKMTPQSNQQAQQHDRQHPPGHNHHHHHNHHPSTTASTTTSSRQAPPEIFSRLVMTNVSNLTKITKDLTMRMPRSSFRDFMLSSSAAAAQQQSTFPTTPSSGAVVTTNVSTVMAVTSTSSTSSVAAAATPSSILMGAPGHHPHLAHPLTYGPAGASILASRKGSLI